MVVLSSRYLMLALARDRMRCVQTHMAPCLQAAAPEAPPAAGSERKLWGGRFTGKTDPLMEKFNESLPFDKRMWAEDIRVRGLRVSQPRAYCT